MRGKPASILALFLLLVSTIVLAHNIQLVKSDYTWTQTIIINADGSIQPPTAPISSVDNVTYTLTDNITGVPSNSSAITIQRDNIILNGAGYAVQGTPYGQKGIYLPGRTSVKIENATIKAFRYGILLDSSSNNSIVGNSVTNGGFGIYLSSSSNNSIAGNSVTNSPFIGILLDSSSNNSIVGNNATANLIGISLGSSSNNSIVGNSLTNNDQEGIRLDSSSFSNSVYHNNFVNDGAYIVATADNTWDNGYPSGGNYWSGYTGLDQKCGPSQDQPGSDGMGDTPIVIDSENRDNYPLMNPWTPPAGHNIAVVSVVSSKIVICQGFSGNINVYGANKGEYPETFKVTLSAHSQTTVNQTGLVGYWKFDEGSGTTAYDSSGNGNNGILVNGPTWTAGKYGEALSFEGINDYVEIAENTDLNPYTSDWTVSAWVNLNELCPYIYGQPSIYGFVILGKRQSNSDNSLTLLVHSGTNATSQARFGFIWDGNMQAAGAQSDLMNVFGWHHVVGVRRGGELYVYVDGVEYGPNNYLYAGNNITSTTSISSATPVRLAYHGSWSYSFRNNGTIDEARIYNRSLSAGEILAQYEGKTIQTRTVTLAGAASATLAFVWSTTGFTKGNYTLSAYAEPVLGETYTADNNFTDGWVVVSMVGDLTGGGHSVWDFVPDGSVDGSDLIVVAMCFGSWPGAPPPYRWNANCDITNDSFIDGSDLIIIARHFGETSP